MHNSLSCALLSLLLSHFVFFAALFRSRRLTAFLWPWLWLRSLILGHLAECTPALSLSAPRLYFAFFKCFVFGQSLSFERREQRRVRAASALLALAHHVQRLQSLTLYELLLLPLLISFWPLPFRCNLFDFHCIQFLSFVPVPVFVVAFCLGLRLLFLVRRHL